MLDWIEIWGILRPSQHLKLIVVLMLELWRFCRSTTGWSLRLPWKVKRTATELNEKENVAKALKNLPKCNRIVLWRQCESDKLTVNSKYASALYESCDQNTHYLHRFSPSQHSWIIRFFLVCLSAVIHMLMSPPKALQFCFVCFCIFLLLFSRFFPVAGHQGHRRSPSWILFKQLRRGQKGGSNLKVFLTKETKTNQKNTEAFT